MESRKHLIASSPPLSSSRPQVCGGEGKSMELATWCSQQNTSVKDLQKVKDSTHMMRGSEAGMCLGKRGCLPETMSGPTFTAAVPTTAMARKQPGLPQWGNGRRSGVHTMQHYSAIKMKESPPSMSTWTLSDT